MQSNPRIVANLLVMSVRILVNLLVKLTKLRLGGAMGGLPPRGENLVLTRDKETASPRTTICGERLRSPPGVVSLE